VTDHWTTERDPADDWDLEEEPLAEGEWEDYRERRGGGCAKKVFLGLLVLLLAGAVGGYVAWGWVGDQIDPPGEPGAEVEIEIPNGSTTARIGEILEENGVITSSRLWDYWTRFQGAGPFQAGFFVFRENMAFREAVAVLDGGPRPPQFERVTIPEALTVDEILPRLAERVDRWSLEALQAAASSGEIRSRFQPEGESDCVEYGGAPWCALEGFLFPDTYEIDGDVDEAAFLRRLVAEMDARLTALDVETRAAALGRTPYEILVIASLIEEETRISAERPVVARVIYNRLDQGIPLGIDATSRYEAEISGRGREALDFTSDSPYNTRRVAGIPPTPIAAPGQASLEAALEPADGNWIYYVLQDAEGNHFFTDSYAEFNRAKAECARNNLGCG
jgi:UPF0755 protein